MIAPGPRVVRSRVFVTKFYESKPGGIVNGGHGLDQGQNQDGPAMTRARGSHAPLRI
jgi:hypothetical protein